MLQLPSPMMTQRYKHPLFLSFPSAQRPQNRSESAGICRVDALTFCRLALTKNILTSVSQENPFADDDEDEQGDSDEDDDDDDSDDDEDTKSKRKRADGKRSAKKRQRITGRAFIADDGDPLSPPIPSTMVTVHAHHPFCDHFILFLTNMSTLCLIMTFSCVAATVEEVNYEDDEEEEEHEATEAELLRAEQEALAVRERRQKELEKRRKELEGIEYEDDGEFDHRAFESKCAHARHPSLTTISLVSTPTFFIRDAVGTRSELPTIVPSLSQFAWTHPAHKDFLGFIWFDSILLDLLFLHQTYLHRNTNTSAQTSSQAHICTAQAC